MRSTDLSRRVGRFRWGAYGGFALIPLALGWQEPWPNAQVMLALVLLGLPSAYGALETRFEGVERFENLLTPTLAAAAGLPLLPGLAMLAALLAGTLARGGSRALLPALTCLACGWFAGRGAGIAPIAAPSVTADVLAIVFLMGLSAPLVALGYEGTLAQYRHRQHLQQASSRLIRQGALLAQFLPPDLDRRLAVGAAEVAPARRWLTVAAVDLADFAALVERLDAEDLLVVLDDLYGWLADLCASHAGALHKFVGDGAIICFGTATPVSRRRAAAQCCAMLEALPAGMQALNAAWRDVGIDVDLCVRAGAASGYCAVGAIGRGERRDYTVIGSAVNLACRLQSCAPLGRAVVDGATADLLDVAARERVDVRGFAEPVRVHALNPAGAVDAQQAPH